MFKLNLNYFQDQEAGLLPKFPVTGKDSLFKGKYFHY